MNKKGSIVTVGVFDGVHMGHRIIIKKAQEEAKQYGLNTHVLSIIYPFDYYKKNFKGLIITPAERLEKIENLGVDSVTFLDLVEIKNLSPEEFVKDILLKLANTVKVIVGHDFKFGRDRKGDVNFLRFLGNKYGFSVCEVPPIFHKNKRISSTFIRELISDGRIDEANEFLGEPYHISGVVVEGKRLGRKLGFPTINIRRPNERLVVPKNGVYVVRVYIDGDYFPGVMNIGLNPTVSDDQNLKYEVYIIDFSGDLYNKKVKVQLLDFLRGEEKFKNIEELKEKIREDVERARRFFNHNLQTVKEDREIEVQVDSDRFRWYVVER
ncbi:MAG: riboflavin kinase / adenylyltransferase [Thermotogaceae bacterium]|nr:riboflavin kinase / adenylyltransferase [Thermotogaceae bacterium]MDN5338235.1 riboflavin kinase / adenylyltransferase [Thermotogaceae bacterium]